MSRIDGVQERDGLLLLHLRQWVEKASRSAGSALFPDTCLGCGRHLARQGGVCPSCWREVRFIEEPVCAVTGMPFTHDFGAHVVSADAIANPPDYDTARAACMHAGVARQLVTRLKYADRTDLAPWMARWMTRAGADMIRSSDVIIPVPLYPTRLWRRRYNQAAELARAVSRQAGLPMITDALKRTRPTRPQVGLTANQRETNVRAAFNISPAKTVEVIDRAVVLVDDVMTTGATVNSAARTLKKAGADAVHVLTFSRVVSGEQSPMSDATRFRQDFH